MYLTSVLCVPYFSCLDDSHTIKSTAGALIAIGFPLSDDSGITVPALDTVTPADLVSTKTSEAGLEVRRKW
jgi:hypothetical protein